ncbi:MAG: hybrid sensor histidine kinase/response regulator [Gammaproteobacteria bacterium]|nr:hybrid sensor histidine kinase/response regulator [Gammaproteobacteria bacterium]
MSDGGLGDFSMQELFSLEAEQQAGILSQGLLELEQDPTSAQRLEPLMRAAHSVKGAARMVDFQAAVDVAHVMEDCFVAAQDGALKLSAEYIDVLLSGVDMINRIAALGESWSDWHAANRPEYDGLLLALAAVREGKAQLGDQASAQHGADVGIDSSRASAAEAELESKSEPGSGRSPALPAAAEAASLAPATMNGAAARDNTLRISTDQVNRLMGLAGEAVVESRWLRPHAESLLRLKRRQVELAEALDHLGESLLDIKHSERSQAALRDVQSKVSTCRHVLADRLADLEAYDRRSTHLSSRLHREVVASRMCTFGEGVQGFPRMVRDVARSLGKRVHLDVEGQATLVDRDILSKIEAPLNHLLRNAIDHGIESIEQRDSLGKPTQGTIRLRAHHSAGMLSIVVEDDGAGVDLSRLRDKVLERALATPEMAQQLTEAELLEFLFLPSFTTRDEVSEISGRGVGLDVVHDVVQAMRGFIRISSTFGKGTRFHMQLPLTLSVIPCMLVNIATEPYAFPLARIERIMQVERSAIQVAEGHQFITMEQHRVGLVSAAQILDLDKSAETESAALSVIVIGERDDHYGLVVDGFVGERDMVVHVLPPRLGKVRDISAAALMEDGTPLLIVDVDDILRSIEKQVAVGRVRRIQDRAHSGAATGSCKRILVVDDSITVREVERNLLQTAGYHVEVAVDGMDGWHALHSGLRNGHSGHVERRFDLVISDVDMPRMDGIELLRYIKADPQLGELPVMIVSYKDRDEDRRRGLDAGADYYLTKGSFHDDTLREAVVDLIGEAAS